MQGSGFFKMAAATALSLLWILILTPLLAVFRLLLLFVVALHRVRLLLAGDPVSSEGTGIVNKRRVWVWGLGAGVISVAVGGVAATLVSNHLNSPVSDVANLSSFQIDNGMTALTVSKRLESMGLIRSATFFRLRARYDGSGQNLRAGIHEIDQSWPTDRILSQLLKGGAILHRVTVREGLTIPETAGVLGNSLKNIDSAEVADLAFDSLFSSSLGSDSASLEGYLFPDTYSFGEHMSAKQVIVRMVERFDAIVTQEWRAQADSLGMSVHQVLTLASIVEKEAQTTGEKAIISQVFHTRLERNMLLGSDPTVKYITATARKKQWLSTRDVTIDSPYNTYLYEGLPPGPICSPGAEAIEAALWPDSTDYVYFVANWDGTHTFSRTLRQHNRAKKKSRRIYLEMRRAQRRTAAKG